MSILEISKPGSKRFGPRNAYLKKVRNNPEELVAASEGMAN